MQGLTVISFKKRFANTHLSMLCIPKQTIQASYALIICYSLTPADNNLFIINCFKEAMSQEFEIIGIELIANFLGIELKQQEDNFISVISYSKKILKQFAIKDCHAIGSPSPCATKLAK